MDIFDCAKIGLTVFIVAMIPFSIGLGLISFWIATKRQRRSPSPLGGGNRDREGSEQGKGYHV